MIRCITVLLAASFGLLASGYGTGLCHGECICARLPISLFAHRNPLPQLQPGSGKLIFKYCDRLGDSSGL